MSETSKPGLLARLFLIPLRLASGWGRTPRLLGSLGILGLILMRLSIGFHFYSEGVDKMSSDFDAGRFFSTARGPFAEMFYEKVWDFDGRVRLNREKTIKAWDRFASRIKSHYALESNQQKEVNAAVQRAMAQLDWVYEANANEIEEFRLGTTRLADLSRDQARNGVDSLGAQRDAIRREWQQLIAPVFSQIDQIWVNLETEANSVANDTQKPRGYQKLVKPITAVMDTSVMNPIIPYFDLMIGVCLMLGLFTPAVALIAAAFLGSVFMSQYPPTTGPGSTYYHMAEAAGCLVLASTGAGRFAGLDFIIFAICRRVWPTTTEQN